MSQAAAFFLLNEWQISAGFVIRCQWVPDATCDIYAT